MSTAVHLAAPDDMKRLLPLVRAFHAEMEIEMDEGVRQGAIAPMLTGIPQGAIYLIGPRTAPVGYVALAFGWSIQMGGLDGFIEEFYVRPAVRGRGMGGEVLHALAQTLKGAGLKSLHLEASRTNPRIRGLYERWGFVANDDYYLMTWQA
ncbi:MAG: GNAT family N-acetyltransferase [Pseudomonadota bacterium]